MTPRDIEHGLLRAATLLLEGEARAILVEYQRHGVSVLHAWSIDAVGCISDAAYAVLKNRANYDNKQRAKARGKPQSRGVRGRERRERRERERTSRQSVPVVVVKNRGHT